MPFVPWESLSWLNEPRMIQQLPRVADELFRIQRRERQGFLACDTSKNKAVSHGPSEWWVTKPKKKWPKINLLSFCTGVTNNHTSWGYTW